MGILDQLVKLKVNTLYRIYDDSLFVKDDNMYHNKLHNGNFIRVIELKAIF